MNVYGSQMLLQILSILEIFNFYFGSYIIFIKISYSFFKNYGEDFGPFPSAMQLTSVIKGSKDTCHIFEKFFIIETVL